MVFRQHQVTHTGDRDETHSKRTFPWVSCAFGVRLLCVRCVFDPKLFPNFL
jgi:hypothetical protein